MTPPDPQPPPESDHSAEEETVRKVYVRDLREREPLFTVFRVTRKARQTARSGKAFLVLSLGDRTGEVDGRIFEGADALEPRFAPGDYVLVRGHVSQFQGHLQVVVESLERLDPEPIDPAEFAVPEATPPAPGGAETPAAPPTSEESRPVAQIRELVERVQDPNVRALLLAFLDDPAVARGLPLAPAAKGIHHAHRGGLAEHILSVMRLGHRVADHYPMLDRDLVAAGALLHDIGKVSELSYAQGGTQYTDEGRLVGHLVMTAQQIHAKAAAIPGFPPLLEQHLTHIVLAHHGQLEYGSPKLPMTLEAHVVHAIDSLDSRLASWMELMARDPNETWTEPTRLYERHLWKGPAPTQRGRTPVEGRRRRDRKGRKAGPTPEAPGGAPSRPPRPERPRKEEAPMLSFKPLEALAGPDPAPPEPSGTAPEASSAVEPDARL